VQKSSGNDVALNDFGQLFAHDGKMDKFYQSVRPYLDTSRKPWRTRTMGQASLAISRTTLNSLQNADDIRNVFFAADRANASVSFDLTPIKMDKTIAMFTLDWGDGSKKLRYDHGPQRSETIKWPSSGGRQEARVEISPPGPRGSGISEKGPWALLKLLDAADIQATKDRQRYFVTFTIDGRKTILELRTHSAFNPFTLAALQNFRCPEHL
jgi:type VI secretion system protein ImpL